MDTSNDIAIVGMALRVPGSLSPAEFWRNLRQGAEALQSFPDDELKALGVPASHLEDPDYVRSGMPLAAFDEFDPEFFGFSPMEAAVLDPQHRQFYEVAWEALESAGCVPAKFDGAIGVFAGCGAGTYFSRNILQNSELLRSVGYFLLRHTGNDKDFLSTRVSYAFNLRGPSISVQTACSTSLVATHLAVQSLLARETDLALAGGVTIELPQRVGYFYREGEILSPDGHCRAFDHRSKGTVFGSGVGVVALRRLEDALRDGDHIHAVIKASAVNNDGASKVGYLAPSVEGQVAAISEAIAVAGIDSDSIGFVECHGTGTPIGDPIEVAALTQAFRESSSAVGHCLLGSVKSNIGHLDTAAGVAGLIKAAMALEFEEIPSTLNFEAPNPALELDGSPFRIAAALTPWPRQATPRRAAVNSLGVGGTNAFIVLEEAPAIAKPAPTTNEVQVLALSARSRKSLDDYQLRLAKWLRDHPETPFAQVASSLGRGRHIFEQRRVFAARDAREAVQLLESGDARRVFTHAEEVERPSMVFMFPGGGAQYAGMARALYQSTPQFRDAMDEGFELLRTVHGADLQPIFAAEPGTRSDLDQLLSRPSVQLPLIFLIEYALVKLWESFGVKPAALIGHSMGENAAACVAGVFSLVDGLGLVLLRGQLMDAVPDGGMLSVPLAADELRSRLGGQLDLAAANSPLLSIASGPNAALDELQARLASEGIEARRVRINIAAHSRLLEGILDRFRAYLQSIPLHAPAIPIVSNLTGKWLTNAEAGDPGYWVQHLRNTVQFADGVRLLLEQKARVFLEVGPGSILGSFVRQSHDASVQRVFASLRHSDDPVSDEIHFKTVAARLWSIGVPIPEERLWPGEWPKIPLPTYAFQHARYWIDPSAADTVQQDDDALLPEAVAFGKAWFHGPRWLQQGIPEISPEEKKDWCVFHHQDALATACVSALRSQGHRVTEVISGDAFARLDDDTYTIAPEVAAAYDELLQALVMDNRVPDRVLHTWLLTRSETFRPGQTFLHRNQVHGFYSLFHLARASSKRAAGKRAHWIVAGNGAVSTGREPLLYPEKATVLGPCAVVPRELKDVTCAYVDISLNDEGAAHGLLQELHAEPANAVLAWRNRVRSVRYLAPHHQKSAALSISIREGGTYFITGGFGGVAGVLAEWLARKYKAQLILVGRTPLPQRPEWDRWLAENPATDSISSAIERIRFLESLGARVLPVAADISVAEQAVDAVAAAKEAFGSLHGVFHAAGVLRDGLIALKNEREVEDVLAAKLYGTLVLDEALKRESLEFVVLFSSASAFVAPAGQIDYVAANSFLNAFAESCRDKRSWPVIAIDWGIWKDLGMAGGHQERGPNADASQLEMTRGKKERVSYPLFDAHYVLQDGRSQIHWITGSISTRGSWIADEHRLLNGQALVPGTGYLEIMRAALGEIGDTTEDWKATGVRFLEPFYVADEGLTHFRIHLKGTSGNWQFELQVRSGSNETHVWNAVATAKIASTSGPVPESVSGKMLAARCNSVVEAAGGDASLPTRQEAHLRFGPRWQVLHSLRLGEGEALAALLLPSRFIADLQEFPLHPGLVDIATGCAMDLIPGYREQEVPQNLWVPVSYSSFACHGALPAECLSWVRIAANSGVAEGSAVFDVTIFDVTGRVLATVEGLALRKIEGSLRPPRVVPAADKDVERGGSRRANQSPGEKALAHNLSRGITAEDGVAALERILAGVDRPVIVVSSIPPADLLRQADAVSSLSRSEGTAKFARPKLDTSFEEPRDEVERSLSELWGKLLGVDGVGIRDSFFELGGHSLIAVRLFNEISDKYGTDLPMSALIQHPDITSLAELVRGGPVGEAVASASQHPVAEKAFIHAIPIKSGPVGNGTPIFIVSGMFGNVLNLSHLAQLLGEDRAFFALQARGLYGDQLPHETFEDMARDYLAEVRRIQPVGPYFLGGFSGGGLVAFEMARQLEVLGERVAALILLDTPIRGETRFGLLDKIEMWLPGLRAEGPRFLVNKLRARREWRKELAARHNELRNEGQANAQFHSRRVGDAFLRALAAYKVPVVGVQATLLRPKLGVKFRLRDGRMIDADRNVLLADNGWTPYVREVTIIEVPGNHDSMVLEPNVRVLAAALRRVLAEADTRKD